MNCVLRSNHVSLFFHCLILFSLCSDVKIDIDNFISDKNIIYFNRIAQSIHVTLFDDRVISFSSLKSNSLWKHAYTDFDTDNYDYGYLLFNFTDGRIKET